MTLLRDKTPLHQVEEMPLLAEALFEVGIVWVSEEFFPIFVVKGMYTGKSGNVDIGKIDSSSQFYSDLVCVDQAFSMPFSPRMGLYCLTTVLG